MKQIYQQILSIIQLIIIGCILLIPLWLGYLISWLFKPLGLPMPDAVYIDFLKETINVMGNIRGKE